MAGVSSLLDPKVAVAPALGSRRQAAQGHSTTMSVAKRIFDLLAILAAAPAVLLILAIAMLAIVISSGRPIFFIQDRIGLRGRVFPMIKLRTMRAVSASDAVAASIGDQRVTSVGRVLRRYRIDELPQLLNVLKGDMSLIGPRPEQPILVEQYRRVIPDFDHRHLVKPGITGLAQVMYGYASNVEETQIKVEYDRFYVENASMLLEAKIVIWTMQTVFGCRGAR